MNRVARSQAVLVSAHAGRLVLFVAITGMLGRNLEPADFGFVALVSNLYFVAAEVLDMGTTAVATRNIAANPQCERETLTALLALRRLIGTVLVAAVLALAISPYITQSAHRLVLVAVACGLLFSHLNAYFLVFQIRQAYGRAVALGLAAQLGFFLVGMAALALHAAGVVIALLVVAREIVQVLGGRWVAVRMLGNRLHATWIHSGVWPLLKAGWMMGVAGICYKLASYMGGFLLWNFATPESLAIFNAAQRLLAPIVDMAWWFALPLVASMSLAAAHSATAFRIQLEGYAKFLLGASALVLVSGYFTAPLVVGLVYGELYVTGAFSAIEAFQWLALACLFSLVTPVMVVGEVVHGNARALIFTGIGCLGLSLAANAWAIPKYGAAGAAMASCLSEAFFFLILLVQSVIRREVRLNSSWLGYLVPASLLSIALSLLEGARILQFAVALAWAPAALLVIMRFPAQKARRSSVTTIAISR